MLRNEAKNKKKCKRNDFIFHFRRYIRIGYFWNLVKINTKTPSKTKIEKGKMNWLIASIKSNFQNVFRFSFVCPLVKLNGDDFMVNGFRWMFLFLDSLLKFEQPNRCSSDPNLDANPFSMKYYYYFSFDLIMMTNLMRLQIAFNHLQQSCDMTDSWDPLGFIHNEPPFYGFFFCSVYFLW